MLCYHCMHDKTDAAVCPYCGAESDPVPMAHHLVPGTVLGGRYTVGMVVDEGGYIITYIGLDNMLNVIVTIREFYHPDCVRRNTDTFEAIPILPDSEAEAYEKEKQRFLTEAKAFAKHGNVQGIAKVIDCFEENNTVYVVTEYPEGVTLNRYLDVRGALSTEETVTMLTPVMRTLENLHSAKLFHCHVSPDSIFMLRDGSFKLTVFNVVHDYGAPDHSFTARINPGYAPEELYRSNGARGSWTDVYSICAVLYRCITGETPIESIDRVFEDRLISPSDMGIRISQPIEDVLLYGLAVRKEDRCPDMTELLKRISKAQTDSYKPEHPNPEPPKPEPPKPEPLKPEPPKPEPPKPEPIVPEPSGSGSNQGNNKIARTAAALCASVLALFVFLTRNLIEALGNMYHYYVWIYILVPIASIVLGVVVFAVCKKKPQAFPAINTAIGALLALIVCMSFFNTSIYDGMSTIWTVGGVVATLLTGVVIGAATAVYSVSSGNNPPDLKARPGTIAFTYIVYFAAMYFYIIKTPVQFSFTTILKILVGICAPLIGAVVFFSVYKNSKSESSIFVIIVILLLLMIPAYLAALGRIDIPHGGAIELTLGSVNAAMIEAVILAKVLRRKSRC